MRADPSPATEAAEAVEEFGSLAFDAINKLQAHNRELLAENEELKLEVERWRMEAES